MIQTPVYTMHNPRTGSTLTLVGLVHTAQPAYYQQIKAILTGLATIGATVHYERVVAPTSEQLAAAPKAMRKLCERYSVVEDTPKAHLVAGLVDQWDVFSPDPGWERHDLTRLETLEYFGLDGADEWIERRRAARTHRIHPDDRVVCAVLLNGLAEIPRLIRGGVPRSEWGDEQMLGLAVHREAVEMDAADRHLASHPGSDLALAWGTAHTPGFREAFAERGYEDKSEEWITAIDPSALLNAVTQP